MSIRSIVFLTSLSGCLWQWYVVIAQEEAKPDTKPAVVSKVSPKDLRDGELAVSGRFARFERMLSQMADILGRQDPERADLLRRAIGKGREDLVREDIEKIVELLDKGELGTASEKQARVVTSLQTLLKLLQSEDRRSSVERERERLNELLKNVRDVLAEQKSARAATKNSEAPSSAAPGQQRALNETEKLIEAMKEHDDEEAKEGQKSTDGEGEPQDGKSEHEEPTESDSKDGQSEKGQSEKGQSKKSKSSDEKPKDGKSEGDPQDSQQSKGDPSKSDQPSSGQQKSGQQSGKKTPKQTPGREQLEKAKEQMQQALEKLKQQQREEALRNEDQAIEELHDATEKLEEMLRQLREEEKEMILASLEARFQRMLIAETQIHEGTLSLAAIPQKEWLDQYYGRCRELAQQQVELATECAQTVNLLQEDGTSVSILLAVQDIESDMSSVTGWLQESKVGTLTQSVQTDIIESLKQLIETTQQAMQEMKEQHQQQQQNQQDPNGEKESALVELMAEIRTLRNLQLQVNRRTKKVDGLMQTAPREDQPSLQKQIHDLSVRQKRLIETAKELSKQAR
jgi:hypothetical protein